jgi:hypothetical protein
VRKWELGNQTQIWAHFMAKFKPSFKCAHSAQIWHFAQKSATIYSTGLSVNSFDASSRRPSYSGEIDIVLRKKIMLDSDLFLLVPGRSSCVLIHMNKVRTRLRFNWKLSYAESLRLCGVYTIYTINQFTVSVTEAASSILIRAWNAKRKNVSLLRRDHTMCTKATSLEKKPNFIQIELLPILLHSMQN